MKDFSAEKEQLITYVENLDEEKVINLATKLLDDGLEPIDLLDAINEGMNQVGKLYERKDYYIADLIMAGLIFKQVLELDRMTAHFDGRKNRKIGKVVLGTVKGDIHDIGKDIFRGMMEANGFEVADLGVDVPKELFVKKTEELRPEIVGMSGVLTNTVESMKDVIDALSEAGLREQVKIIIGGNHLTEEACRYIGANSFANDASSGVRLCREWLNGVDGRGDNDNA